MALTTEKLNSSDEQICDGDSAETIEKNPKSWAAWKRESERLQAIIDANQVAAPAGYFVRHRSTWNNPSTWSMWTECSGEDYAEYCKRIATGEADAGRFYEARILYDAPPVPQSTNAADWGINMQTGTPILVYKNCSVIESEQAHYVLSLINGAATPAPAKAVAWEMRYWNSGYNMWGEWERITAEQHAEMSVQHATDNDYEFRVLYDAPPAPAVPDDYQHLKNVRELYHKQEDRLFSLAQRIKGASFDKYSHIPSQAIDVLEREIFGDDGDACRVAMPASRTPQSQQSITEEAIDRIVVPLSLDGLDEEKHHCEWHLYHDRERIRKELREYFAAPRSPEELDKYTQGVKDGLDWAARTVEANHPNTGDWLYDDRNDLAKAIRKGPDMLAAALEGGN